MSVYKTGRWSNDEIDLTKRLVEDGKTYDEISQILNRPVDTVKSTVENRLLMNLSEEIQKEKQIENDIRASVEWRELEKQLSPDEQDTFVHHWIQILAQFDNDFTHTERLQIIDVCRTEILVNRVLKRINDTNSNIADFQTQHLYQMSLEPAERDGQLMIQLTGKIGDLTQAIGSYNKEYKELMERKQLILKDIKGTRDQRIQRIASSTESLTGWMAKLVSSYELRHKMGIHLEKFRLAQEVELEKLSDYFTYDDGTVDQPILNADTLKEDNY